MNFKTFGSLGFASTLENNRTKLEPRSRKCVFIEYKIGVKGYVLLDVKSKEIFICRNVIFHKSTFPYKYSINHNLDHGNNNQEDDNLLLEPIKDFREIVSHSHSTDTDDTRDNLMDNNSNNNKHNYHNSSSNEDTKSVNNTNQEEDLRKSSKIKIIPTYLTDYDHRVSNVSNNSSHIKIKHPISSILSYDFFI